MSFAQFDFENVDFLSFLNVNFLQLKWVKLVGVGGQQFSSDATEFQLDFSLGFVLAVSKHNHLLQVIPL